jgi:hypothetical protein
MPAKPRSIIAHVEGSRTAEASCVTTTVYAPVLSVRILHAFPLPLNYFLRAAFAQSRRLATSFSFRALFQRQFTDKLHDAIFDDIGFNADP